MLVQSPSVHFPIAVAALLRQLVPGLRLRQQLRNGALRQPQNVLGEEPLPNVVDREQLAHPPRDVQRVQILGRVLVHVVAQHLLQLRLHGVALGDEALAQPPDHRSGRQAELLGEAKGRPVLVESVVGTLQGVLAQEVDGAHGRGQRDVVVAEVLVVVVFGAFGVAVE